MVHGRTAKQLLPLLKLLIMGIGGIISIARAKEGGAVCGERFQFPLHGINVGFMVAEARVYRGTSGGRNVLFFYAHLIELSQIPLACPEPKAPRAPRRDMRVDPYQLLCFL